MPKRVNTTVHVRHPQTGADVRLNRGDEVPDWAEPLIKNPAVFEDLPEPFPAHPREGERVSGPSQRGTTQGEAITDEARKRLEQAQPQSVASSTAGENLYDPGRHKVDEVLDYAEDHPDEIARLIEAERAGKNRSTLVSQLEQVAADAEADLLAEREEEARREAEAKAQQEAEAAKAAGSGAG